MAQINGNLLPQLLPVGVNQAEFENLVRIHFGRATGSPGENSVFLSFSDNKTIGGKVSTYALKLKYSKKGTLHAIEPGPALTTEILKVLVKRIKDELVTDSGIFIGAAIMFSALPVQGYWRYRDVFQLLPAPSAAPQAGHMLGTHPFVLEFAVKNSPDWIIRQQRAHQKKRELGLLLNAFLEGHVNISGSSKNHWVLIEDLPPRRLKTVNAQEGYNLSGFKHEKEKFSEMADIPSLSAVEMSDFYSRRGLGVSDWKMHRPQNLDALFDKYSAFPVPVQKRFLTACFWFNYALQASQDSRSASYIALVQSIEALLPENVNSNCVKCGQPQYKCTERFNDFLKTFAPYKDGIARGRKELYGLRSDLSHGKRLLAEDIGLHWAWKEQHVWEEMRQTARIAFANWILTNHAKI